MPVPKEERYTYAEISLGLTTLERIVCDDMKVAGGLVSDADLLRVALWNQAKHFEIDLPARAFRLQRRRDPRRAEKVSA